MTVVRGYIGIDNGTQGLTVLFTDESMNVLATGEGHYDMVPDLGDGCYEQHTRDWDDALVDATKQVREKILPHDLEVLGIGISGQMHGEVLADQTGQALGPVRLWCDARNERECAELTQLFSVKIPKRSTIARFLWTTRNRPERAKATRHITTPAGWIAFRLTGEWNLGVGDASGMFPVDQTTMDYDSHLMQSFDQLVNDESVSPIADLLPRVCTAGEPAGTLTAEGSKLLGLPHVEGIPVAAAEGDQTAALAGSLIGRAGTVSCCFGTSVCANSVGDRAFEGVSTAVDQFCAADGKPINMVWLRNGTTFMNTIVESYYYGNDASVVDDDDDSKKIAGSNKKKKKRGAFDTIMPKLIDAAPDCGGLLALPFMDDEPGLGVAKGGSALVVGWNPTNATPGNVAKAALLSTVFNLKMGSEVLDQQGYPRTELVLTGGLAKTPACGQILADVFHTPALLHGDSADEGSCWGAALLAKFRHLKEARCSPDTTTDTTTTTTWVDFLDSVKTAATEDEQYLRFQPDANAGRIYDAMYLRYKKLIELQPMLARI